MTIRSRVARALRPLAVCVLVVAAAGVVPAAGSCLESLLGCGDVCTRCLCKHRNDTDALRKTCPCCQRHPGTPDQITGAVAAILPGATASFAVPSTRRPVPLRACFRISYSPSVPHPPPRAL
jgi:hypothetical protein